MTIKGDGPVRNKVPAIIKRTASSIAAIRLHPNIPIHILQTPVFTLLRKENMRFIYDHARLR